MFLPILLCLGTHGAVRSLCSPHAMVCSLCIRFLLCKPYKGRRDVMKMCFGSLYWKKMECHVRKSQSKEIWLKASGSEHSRQTGPRALLGIEETFFETQKSNNKNITQSGFYSHLQSKPAHLNWSLLRSSLFKHTGVLVSPAEGKH